MLTNLDAAQCLINGIEVLRKYYGENPIELDAQHDILYVGYDNKEATPEKIDSEDHKVLRSLRFNWDEDCGGWYFYT